MSAAREQLAALLREASGIREPSPQRWQVRVYLDTNAMAQWLIDRGVTVGVSSLRAPQSGSDAKSLPPEAQRVLYDNRWELYVNEGDELAAAVTEYLLASAAQEEADDRADDLDYDWSDEEEADARIRRRFREAELRLKRARENWVAGSGAETPP